MVTLPLATGKLDVGMAVGWGWEGADVGTVPFILSVPLVVGAMVALLWGTRVPFGGIIILGARVPFTMTEEGALV